MPQAGFGGQYFHEFPHEMGAAYLFHLVRNHAFIDGNKRCGHAAMETFLVLNGKELEASVDEVEKIILQVASGNLSLEKLVDWVRSHLRTFDR